MSILSTADEGKYLMDAEGEQIGIVTEVDTGGSVETITDTELRVPRDL